MNRLKEIIFGLLMLVFSLWVNIGYAQTIVAGCRVENVMDATKVMRKFGVYTSNPQFQDEINNLPVDNEQFVIPGDEEDLVWVAMLVRNRVDSNKGDYAKYWEEKKINTQKLPKEKKINRYTWVFIPENFMSVCYGKEIFPKAGGKVASYTNQKILSKRLCQLLGLSDTEPRDTIVYMKVKKESLFRPSYHPEVSNKLEKRDCGKINSEESAKKASISKWMAQQQQTNSYPWTRMGYTFDWGDDSVWDINNNATRPGFIGVSEFVVMPGTAYSDLGYVTIDALTTNDTWKKIAKIKQK